MTNPELPPAPDNSDEGDYVLHITPGPKLTPPPPIPPSPEESSSDAPEPEYDSAGTPIVRLGGVPWRAGKTDENGTLVITREEFEAAKKDPKVIEWNKRAREEAKRWEPTEWGFRLKEEYRKG